MNIKELIEDSKKEYSFDGECVCEFVTKNGEKHKFDFLDFDELTNKPTSKDPLYISLFKWREDPHWFEIISKEKNTIQLKTNNNMVSILYIHEDKRITFLLNAEKKIDYYSSCK